MVGGPHPGGGRVGEKNVRGKFPGGLFVVPVSVVFVSMNKTEREIEFFFSLLFRFLCCARVCVCLGKINDRAGCIFTVPKKRRKIPEF